MHGDLDNMMFPRIAMFYIKMILLITYTHKYLEVLNEVRPNYIDKTKKRMKLLLDKIGYVAITETKEKGDREPLCGC